MDHYLTVAKHTNIFNNEDCICFLSSEFYYTTVNSKALHIIVK